MLRWRVIVGSLLIAALAALCWLDARTAVPGAWLFPLWILICAGAATDLAGMWRKRGYPVDQRLIIAGAGAILVGACSPPFFATDRAATGTDCLLGGCIALAVVLSMTMGIAVSRFPASVEPGCLAGQAPSNGDMAPSIGLYVLAFTYIGLFGAFVVGLRLLDVPRLGLAPVLSLIVATKLGDTGAYATGKLIGRRKMAPRLSPGKTWEGAAGALLWSALGSIAFLTLYPRWAGITGFAPSWAAMAGFGLLVGGVGMLGDLVESLLKRDARCKDSSSWLPGLGGLLDVLDSILFAAPVAFLYWEFALKP
jgi:phosphatidate cytidylyltransferase